MHPPDRTGPSAAPLLEVLFSSDSRSPFIASSRSRRIIYFRILGEPSEVVIEACWNWGALYDLLEGIEGVNKVVLSHPAKNRIIADAQIKNDRVDAHALTTLLRGYFVAKVHVPGREVPRCASARTSFASGSGWRDCAR